MTMKTQITDCKQPYTTPKLAKNGTLADLTQQGGGSAVDVPIGTPIGPDGISSVTGNFS